MPTRPVEIVIRRDDNAPRRGSRDLLDFSISLVAA
jgi:hypothetical protein